MFLWSTLGLAKALRKGDAGSLFTWVACWLFVGSEGMEKKAETKFLGGRRMQGLLEGSIPPFLAKNN